MRSLHLFAGAGGGILADVLLGHRCVAAVEIDPYCRRVLERRQRDGVLEKFPVYDDVRTFDGRAWRGKVDLVCGGFPCQDISNAGLKHGLKGSRSSLWWEMHRIVHEVGPRFVFVENVAALLVRGFDRVLGSLADLGFDAEWCVLSAAECGAPHLRQRLWMLAANRDRVAGGQQQEPRAERETPLHVGEDGAEGAVDADTDRNREHVLAEHAEVARASRDLHDTDRPQRQGDQRTKRVRAKHTDARGAGWWQSEPRVGRVADGVPHRMDRLRAIGNAQVPIVAATAFCILFDRLHAEES